MRYCPSIEDKVLRFPDRERHQVILEPDGLDTEEVYANGISTSLPVDVQEELVHSIPGLERAEIMRPGYAIEYDFVPPTQCKATLETRAVAGLYLAGQINGTTGYEEAAALGFWAGRQRRRALSAGYAPFLPDRSEAYMAVMVDDLVTRGTLEPYRMFTSRAEYRLLLREDNADLRLAGHGLPPRASCPRSATSSIEARRERVEDEIERLAGAACRRAPTVNAVLAERGTSPIAEATPLLQLLRRPEVGYADLARLLPENERRPDPLVAAPGRGLGQVRGLYHPHARGRGALPAGRGAGCFRRTSTTRRLPGLSAEIKERLSAVRPRSLGQASRIPGSPRPPCRS